MWDCNSTIFIFWIYKNHKCKASRLFVFGNLKLLVGDNCVVSFNLSGHRGFEFFLVLRGSAHFIISLPHVVHVVFVVRNAEREKSIF